MNIKDATKKEDVVNIFRDFRLKNFNNNLKLQKHFKYINVLANHDTLEKISNKDLELNNIELKMKIDNLITNNVLKEKYFPRKKKVIEVKKIQKMVLPNFEDLKNININDFLNDNHAHFSNKQKKFKPNYISCNNIIDELKIQQIKEYEKNTKINNIEIKDKDQHSMIYKIKKSLNLLTNNVRSKFKSDMLLLDVNTSDRKKYRTKSHFSQPYSTRPQTTTTPFIKSVLHSNVSLTKLNKGKRDEDSLSLNESRSQKDTYSNEKTKIILNDELNKNDQELNNNNSKKRTKSLVNLNEKIIEKKNYQSQTKNNYVNNSALVYFSKKILNNNKLKCLKKIKPVNHKKIVDQNLKCMDNFIRSGCVKDINTKVKSLSLPTAKFNLKSKFKKGITSNNENYYSPFQFNLLNEVKANESENKSLFKKYSKKKNKITRDMQISKEKAFLLIKENIKEKKLKIEQKSEFKKYGVFLYADNDQEGCRELNITRIYSSKYQSKYK